MFFFFFFSIFIHVQSSILHSYEEGDIINLVLDDLSIRKDKDIDIDIKEENTNIYVKIKNIKFIKTMKIVTKGDNINILYIKDEMNNSLLLDIYNDYIDIDKDNLQEKEEKELYEKEILLVYIIKPLEFINIKIEGKGILSFRLLTYSKKKVNTFITFSSLIILGFIFSYILYILILKGIL